MPTKVKEFCVPTRRRALSELSCLAGPLSQAGEQALQFVMERSRDVCLRLHVELPFDAPTEAAILLKKNRAGLSPLSYVVFVSLDDQSQHEQIFVCVL